MGLPPEVIVILLLVAGAYQFFQNLLKRQQEKGAPEKKIRRTYEIEEELRRFLESVSGEEITHQPPPQAQTPPPVSPDPAFPSSLPPVIARRRAATLPAWSPPISTLHEMTPPQKFAPAPLQVPAGPKPEDLAQTLPIQVVGSRLQRQMGNRSLLQQGILFSEIFGTPMALREPAACSPASHSR